LGSVAGRLEENGEHRKIQVKGEKEGRGHLGNKCRGKRHRKKRDNILIG